TFLASRFDNKSTSCSVATSGHFSTVGIIKNSSKIFMMTNHGLHTRSLSQDCEGKDRPKREDPTSSSYAETIARQIRRQIAGRSCRDLSSIPRLCRPRQCRQRRHLG